ncbi:hypothetical protein FOBRF1_000941 [Fusarium oxysporum]
MHPLRSMILPTLNPRFSQNFLCTRKPHKPGRGSVTAISAPVLVRLRETLFNKHSNLASRIETEKKNYRPFEL